MHELAAAQIACLDRLEEVARGLGLRPQHGRIQVRVAQLAEVFRAQVVVSHVVVVDEGALAVEREEVEIREHGQRGESPQRAAVARARGQARARRPGAERATSTVAPAMRRLSRLIRAKSRPCQGSWVARIASGQTDHARDGPRCVPKGRGDARNRAVAGPPGTARSSAGGGQRGTEPMPSRGERFAFALEYVGEAKVVLRRPGSGARQARRGLALERARGARPPRHLAHLVDGPARLRLAMWRGLISYERWNAASASSKRPLPE